LKVQTDLTPAISESRAMLREKASACLFKLSTCYYLLFEHDGRDPVGDADPDAIRCDPICITATSKNELNTTEQVALLVTAYTGRKAMSNIPQIH